jgi:ribosomal protein L11 methyltransferase
MEYIIVKFEIKGDKDLFETSCDLLCAMAGEVGFESFEETEEGVNGYIQKELYNPDDLNSIIDEWPIESTQITYNVGVIENVDWNETWENEGFSPIIINNKCVIYDVRHPSQLPDS